MKLPRGSASFVRRMPALALVFLSAAGGGAGPATTPPAPVAAVAATTLGTAADQFFTVNDVRLRYREIGRGEPVILLHGYTQRLEGLSALADSLARDHHVIALDERGFGESSKFAHPARFGAAMADDVIGLLDHLRLERAHLVGHSMGAVVAANVAAGFPARVATATLLAGPFFADSATFARMTVPWITALERGEGLTAFLVWLFPGTSDSIASGLSAQLLAQNDMGSLLAVMRSMGALVVSRDRGIATPVPALVVVGTGDPLLPQSRDLASWWPRSRLLEVRVRAM